MSIYWQRNDGAYIIKDTLIGTYAVAYGLENCPSILKTLHPAYSGCTDQRRIH